jgi:hypothetical protein
MLGFTQARQVRVNRGGHRAFVTEVDLNLTEVLALLQQVRRVGVAQGVDVRRLFDATGLEGQAEGPLQRGAAHRFSGGGGPQTAVTFGGKKQRRMTMTFPLLAQEQQRALGQRDVTVLIAFATADVQEHAFGINVANLEVQTLTQAQAAGVNGDQADALIQRGNVGQDATRFSGREHDGQFELRIGANQFQFVGPDSFERLFPEEFDGADGLGAGLAGDFLVALEMDAILADVFGREPVGGFVIELTELADAGVVSLFGARADGQELQVIGEGF